MNEAKKKNTHSFDEWWSRRQNGGSRSVSHARHTNPFFFLLGYAIMCECVHLLVHRGNIGRGNHLIFVHTVRTIPFIINIHGWLEKRQRNWIYTALSFRPSSFRIYTQYKCERQMNNCGFFLAITTVKRLHGVPCRGYGF